MTNVIQEMKDSQYKEDETKIKSEVTSESHDSNPVQNVLLFAKIIGKQVIKIRLKQSEHVSGPKVSIEMTFGALNVFLSPRQVYDLVEIATGLFGDPGEDLK